MESSNSSVTSGISKDGSSIVIESAPSSDCHLNMGKKNKSKIYFVVVQNVDTSHYNKDFVFGLIESYCVECMVALSDVPHEVTELRIYFKLIKIETAESFAERMKDIFDKVRPIDIYIAAVTHRDRSIQ